MRTRRTIRDQVKLRDCYAVVFNRDLTRNETEKRCNRLHCASPRDEACEITAKINRESVYVKRGHCEAKDETTKLSYKRAKNTENNDKIQRIIDILQNLNNTKITKIIDEKSSSFEK